MEQPLGPAFLLGEVVSWGAAEGGFAMKCHAVLGGAGWGVIPPPPNVEGTAGRWSPTNIPFIHPSTQPSFAVGCYNSPEFLIILLCIETVGILPGGLLLLSHYNLPLVVPD